MNSTEPKKTILRLRFSSLLHAFEGSVSHAYVLSKTTTIESQKMCLSKIRDTKNHWFKKHGGILHCHILRYNFCSDKPTYYAVSFIFHCIPSDIIIVFVPICALHLL